MTIEGVLVPLVEWIEAHATTVDLIKWGIIGLLAWSLGAFRFLRTKLKKPKLEIESLTSRCILQELGVVDGQDGNVRVVFLIQAGITNPTTEPIVVRDFTLKIKRVKGWPIRNHPLNATTLPSRVRSTIGSTTKYSSNWFSYFEEGDDQLTLNARIDPRDFQSGYQLFVSVSWGCMRPFVQDGGIPVTLHVRLTTGERLLARSKIVIQKDHEALAAMVPGILDHVQNRSVWNIIRQQT